MRGQRDKSLEPIVFSLDSEDFLSSETAIKASDFRLKVSQPGENRAGLTSGSNMDANHPSLLLLWTQLSV